LMVEKIATACLLARSLGDPWLRLDGLEYGRGNGALVPQLAVSLRFLSHDETHSGRRYRSGDSLSPVRPPLNGRCPR